MRTTESVRHVTAGSELAAMDEKPPTPETVSITVRPPAPLAEYLTDLAWSLRQSRSELIVEILADFVERSEAAKP